LRREKRTLTNICVDEDGALAGSSSFATFLRDEEQLNLETTGGYASFINGKVERPNRTLAERARCMLLNAGAPSKDWCFTIEQSAEVYQVTCHYAIKRPPHFAWYGETLNAKDMHIWGCRVLVPAHNLKKADDRATYGRFYGFAKTRSLLRWLDPATDNVKHAHDAHFLDIDLLDPNPSIGERLLALDPASKTCDLTCPGMSIDLGDRPYFDTETFKIVVQLPPIGTPLNIKLSFDGAYHLPYIVSTDIDGVLARSLPANCRRNIYILAIGIFDPVTIYKVLEAFKTNQVAHAISDVDMWIVKRNNRPRTDLEEQRAMFDQVRFAPIEMDLLPEPVACRAVTSLLNPDCPEHVGQMVRSPFRADFKFAHFENYDKMYQAGTWIYPVAKTLLPKMPSSCPFDPRTPSSPQKRIPSGNYKSGLAPMAPI
jgi:hypothetical protein